MFVLLLIIASASLAFPVTDAASNCSVCELDDRFTESIGYACFELNDEQVACTCPDQRYTINEPCRICNRENICGNDAKSICAETSITSLDGKSDRPQYFACFCSDMSYLIGEACPSIPATTTPAISA